MWITHSLQGLHTKCWADTIYLTLIICVCAIPQRFFPNCSKVEMTVEKSIYTVNKSDILTLKLLWHGWENLASNLNVLRYANIREPAAWQQRQHLYLLPREFNNYDIDAALSTGENWGRSVAFLVSITQGDKIYYCPHVANVKLFKWTLKGTPLAPNFKLQHRVMSLCLHSLHRNDNNILSRTLF